MGREQKARKKLKTKSLKTSPKKKGTINQETKKMEVRANQKAKDQGLSL